jgi:hypothetical protein
MVETTVAQPGDALVEKRIAQYVQVRDAIKEANDKFAEQIQPLVETQNLLTAWLTAKLEQVGAESVRTKAGTVYSSTRYSASLADPAVFMDFVKANNCFELIDRKANATAVRDYVETNGSLPPGVNLNAIRTVGVRRASGS